MNHEMFATANGTEYDYRDTNISSFSGIFGNYGLQGYFIDFISNSTNTKFKLEQLKKAEWLDHNTRAIQI
jgi:hypothetical protein